MYAITAILTIVGFFIGFTIGATIKKVKTGKGYFRVIPLEEQPDLATINVRIPSNQDLDQYDQIVLTRE